MGMGAPVSDGDDYAETKQAQMEVGGGLGAVLPAMGPLLRGAANATSGMGKALYNKIRPAFEEADTTLGRGLKEVLGDKRDAVIQLLRANRNPLGQGSAGEVASPAGSSKFSAVQQVANKVDSDAHIDTIASQSAARGDALRTVAGKPGDIQVAEALRNSATAPMREIALMNAQFSAPGVDVSGVMGKVSALIADPSVKGGTATLAPLMKNIMEDLGALTNPSLSGKSPQINARALYAFRQDGLDGILEKFKTAQGGVPRRAAGLIVQIKDELDNAIEKAAGGGWKAYLKKYEDMSRSVDRLNVGKYMTDKLFPNGEEVLTSAADRSSQFSTLLREGTRTVKQATGSKQGRSLEETLTAPQMRSVGNVKADLLRSKDFERLATAGSKGGSEAVSITDPTLPNALWREIMIANSALRSLGDAKEAAILARVAKVFKADPEKGFGELIGILEKISPDRRNVIMSALAKSAPKLGQLMERLNTTAPIGATRLVGES